TLTRNHEHHDTNSVSGFRLFLCCVDPVLVAPTWCNTASGADQRRLHPHPPDSSLKCRPHLPRFEESGSYTSGFTSAPSRSEPEPSHRSNAAVTGVARWLLCEMGHACNTRRRPPIARYVCARDLVDCLHRLLFWSHNPPLVSVSPLLSVLNGPHPRVCLDLDCRIFAISVSGSRANHVSGRWRSSNPGWDHAVYPRAGPGSCPRVQQYPVQSDADCHHHGLSASVSARLVAKTSARRDRDPTLCAQKRPSHLHHRRASHQSRPRFSRRQAPSPWRRHFPSHRSSSDGGIAMDPPPNRVTNAAQASIG